MKIALSLINKYTDIPKDKIGQDTLIDNFAKQVVDVDEINRVGDNLNSIIIGRIEKIEKHSNADNLNIVYVNIGTEQVKIVTGAPNIYMHMIVPVIKSGNTLPSGIKIEPRALRGEMSDGMLCSGKELNISEDHNGILDLGDEFKNRIGKSLSEFLEDIILDIDNKVIGNRGDLFSHMGLAREFAAIQKKPYKPESFKQIQNKSNFNIKVQIDDPKFCKRYTGVIIKNVKVEKSPFWLEHILTKVGINPVNNIVDITNYIMILLGQPLHAFDLDKIGGENSKIIIRKAKKGEKITTLDGKERTLSLQNFLIATNDGPIGIAGVMGGEESEIDENTRNILIESANFDPILTRKSGKAINLRSDALLRYEKGIPLNITKDALMKAIDLILELTRGEIFSNIVDINYPQEKLESIRLQKDRIERILGIKIDDNKIIDILNRLNLISEIKNNYISVKIPEERTDIKEDVDIIEEIGRIYGYDNIPLVVNPIYESAKSINDPLFDIKSELKKIISATGGYEIKTYSFINEKLLKDTKLDSKNIIKIINPISEEYDILRPSLIPSILKNISYNQNHSDWIFVYEIANIYEDINEELPKETNYLTIGILNRDKKNLSYFKIKSVLDTINEYFNIKSAFKYLNEKDIPYIKNKSADIYIYNKRVGEFGEIDPEIKENFNIHGSLAIANINIMDLIPSIKSDKSIDNVSIYPEVKVDMNIVYNKKYIESQDIINHIKDTNIKSIEIIDIYEEEKSLGQDNISITVRLVFQNFNKTFQTKEIQEKTDSIKKSLSEKFKNHISFK